MLKAGNKERESYLITTGMVNTVFLMKSTVKLLFWRGQITSPYFLKGTDQNNGLATSEKLDILDFDNRHFCSLKRLIFDLQQYSILFLALFSRKINKEKFFCLPNSWVNSFGKVNVWDFETSFNIFSRLNQFSLIPGPYNEIS